MGLLEKLKRLGSFTLSSSANDGHPRRDDAESSDFDYGPLPRSFLNAVNIAREVAGYEPVDAAPRRSVPRGNEDFMNHNPRPEFGGFDRRRAASHERHFDRAARHGSPDQLRRHLPGTPIKFRRRPISPELLQPSASSPSVFGDYPVPPSPDMLRHFQHAHHASHIARQQQQQQLQEQQRQQQQLQEQQRQQQRHQQLQEQQRQQQRQQQQQFDMMRHPHANQFYPQFQQPLYPMMHANANMQNWFMMPQQHQPMYPFY